MLSVYPACFFQEENGYSVVFPDLNYLATCGDTITEAMSMAIDCLAGYLYTCKRDGTPIPPPSPMSQISLVSVVQALEVEVGEAFVNMVSVDVAEYAKAHFEKVVKKTLTIPEWLNTAALEQGINFSQILREALIARLSAGKAKSQEITWESSQPLQISSDNVSYFEDYSKCSKPHHENYTSRIYSNDFLPDSSFSNSSVSLAYC